MGPLGYQNESKAWPPSVIQSFDTFLREDQVVLPRDQAIGRIIYGLLNYVDIYNFESIIA